MPAIEAIFMRFILQTPVFERLGAVLNVFRIYARSYCATWHNLCQTEKYRICSTGYGRHRSEGRKGSADRIEHNKLMQFQLVHDFFGIFIYFLLEHSMVCGA